MDSAVAWLGKQQAADGSFGGGSASTTANSNSTGLAGAVLADAGETDRGREGRDLGLPAPGRRLRSGSTRPTWARSPTTTPSLAAAAKKGITAKTSDQFRRASSEALPVLQWLPAGATEGQQVGSC